MQIYWHIVRVQDTDGEVSYHRHSDNFINPDYWECWHHDRYRKHAGVIGISEAVCVNVYKGQN